MLFLFTHNLIQTKISQSGGVWLEMIVKFPGNGNKMRERKKSLKHEPRHSTCPFVEFFRFFGFSELARNARGDLEQIRGTFVIPA